MKKITIILSMLLITTLSYSQYFGTFYQRSDVNVSIVDYSKMSKAQLDLSLQQAKASISTGKVLTIAGSLTTVIGFVVYSSGLNAITEDSYSNIGSNANKAMTGIYVALAGGVLAGIGIPVWIINNNKREQIEVAIVGFKPTSYVQPSGVGVGIKIKF